MDDIYISKEKEINSKRSLDKPAAGNIMLTISFDRNCVTAADV